MTSIQKTDLSPEPGSDGNDNRIKIYTDKARALCASREYCISDIRSRLETWGVHNSDTQEAIIETLIGEKFLDEQRYASAFARDRLRYNKWGKIKIEWSLKMKNVAGDCITEALAGIDEDEYREIAERLIQSLVKSKKAENKQLLKAKILKSMQSKGFEYSVTGEIVKRFV
jgi:regulatory protein